MGRADCPDDLVTRARRFRLSQTDRARLERHLSVCAACRRDLQIGSDFDALLALQPGDDLVVSRMASGALAPFTKSDRRARLRLSPRTLSLAAAALCVLVSVGAGAALVWRHGTSPRAELAQPPLAELPSLQASAVALRTVPVWSRSAPSAESADPVVAAPPRARPSPAVARLPRPTAPSRAVPAVPVVPVVPASDVTARLLFASANDERRRQRADKAVALYGELQRAYSTSEEARLSRVSLGRLLVANGSWLQGLAQLDKYLTSSPNGLLAQEALFGKAKALEALGRRDEERSTWVQLLDQFADSVYAPQARRRIEDLR